MLQLFTLRISSTMVVIEDIEMLKILVPLDLVDYLVQELVHTEVII
jgi:hypothetical protein